MGAAPEPASRVEFARLYEAWFAAIAAHDAGFFRETLADDWYYIDIFGTVRDCEQYIEMVNLVTADSTLQMLEFTVKEKDGYAIVTGNYRVNGVLATGKDVSSSTRFTGLWELGEEESWRCQLHHATRISDG